MTVSTKLTLHIVIIVAFVFLTVGLEYHFSIIGIWIRSSVYNHLFQDFLTCYAVAVPFFPNTILEDFICCSVFFVVFEIAQYPFLMLGLKQV